MVICVCLCIFWLGDFAFEVDLELAMQLKLTCEKKTRPFCMPLYIIHRSVSCTYKLNKRAFFNQNMFLVHSTPSYVALGNSRTRLSVLYFRKLFFTETHYRHLPNIVCHCSQARVKSEFWVALHFHLLFIYLLVRMSVLLTCYFKNTVYKQYFNYNLNKQNFNNAAFS